MHFPPLTQPSAVEQIVNKIAAEANAASASAAPTDEGASAALPSGVAADKQSQVSLSAMRVLHLQLEPEGLGAVSIRMRLAGDRLDLQVEATRADTMRRIGDEKDLRVEKMHAAGFAMDRLVVSVAQPQTMQTQHGFGAGDNPGLGRGGEAAPSLGMSQEGGSSADDGSGARGDREPSAAAAGAEDRTRGRDSSGAVYL